MKPKEPIYKPEDICKLLNYRAEFDPKFVQIDIEFSKTQKLYGIIDVILHMIFLSEIPQASVKIFSEVIMITQFVFLLGQNVKKS